MTMIRPNLGSLLIGLGLFGAIVGLKLAIVDRYGSDLPEWDQWDAEGLAILLPWQQGNLHGGDFFKAHNEHRIVLTKALGLATVAINGQWDARIQCVINACIHAALGVGLFFAGRRLLTRPWSGLWFFALLALFGLPLAWQNVIAGFHSQQYFLLGFSALAIWYLPVHPYGTPRWWIGAVAAILAWFSMGSGFLASAVVLTVALLDLLYRHRPWGSVAPNVILTLALTGAGWFGRVTVDYHNSLRAGSVAEFVTYAVNNLRWPSGSSVVAALIWAPWLVVVIRYLLRRADADQRDPVRLAALGGWALLQILASAYARGAGGGEPASRYMDTLAFGLAINLLTIGYLVAWSAQRPAPMVASWVLAAAWMTAVVPGIYRLSYTNVVQELSGWVEGYHREGESRTRAYLATGRISHLESDQIPYPGATAYRERLDHPELRALLPSSVRPPIPLRESSSAGVFTTDFSRIYRAPADTGLAKETPEPLHGIVHALRPKDEAAHWTSNRIDPSEFGWLVFGMSGQGSGRSIQVRFLDARSDTVLVEMSGAELAPSQWSMVPLPVPDHPFRIDVRAQPGSWVAFKEPVEQAAWSLRAAQLTRRSSIVTGGSLLLALTGLIVSASSRRSERPVNSP